MTLAGGARGGSLERFAEVAFEAFRPPAVAPISLSAGVGGVGGVGGVAGFPSASLLPLSKSPTPADAGAKDSKNVEIAEVIVGAILGQLLPHYVYCTTKSSFALRGDSCYFPDGKRNCFLNSLLFFESNFLFCC